MYSLLFALGKSKNVHSFFELPFWGGVKVYLYIYAIIYYTVFNYVHACFLLEDERRK